MSKKQKEPKDHPGQLGLTDDITKEIREGSIQDDMDDFTKAGKKLADVCVLQMRVALKSGVYEDRINALDAVGRTAGSLASDVRRFLTRAQKVAGK